MEVMLFHFDAQGEILWQVENVVWQIGYTIPLLVQFAKRR